MEISMKYSHDHKNKETLHVYLTLGVFLVFLQLLFIIIIIIIIIIILSSSILFYYLFNI